MSNSELPSLDSPIIFSDAQFTESSLEEGVPFAEALADVHIDFNFTTDYYVHIYEGIVKNIKLRIFKKDSGGAIEDVWSHYSDGFYKYINEIIPIDLIKGQKTYFMMELTFGAPISEGSFTKNVVDVVFPNFSLGISFMSRINTVNIDVISPITVLGKLLDSMTDSTETYSGLIDDYDPRMSCLLYTSDAADD